MRPRERTRFGTRILEGGDMLETHKEFIDWASRYDVDEIDGKSLAGHEAYLKNQQCPVLEFRGERDVSEIMGFLLRTIRGHGSDA